MSEDLCCAVFKMKTFLIVLALLGTASSAVVELSCSDNATCIDDMAREFVRSIRQRKAVKLFDMLTIEPLDRQARSNLDPLTRMIMGHAISFDWDDFTFRFSKPEGRSDAMDLEVFESRTLKEVTEPVPKKAKKEEEDKSAVDDKSKKIPIRRRRRVKRKVFQALVPLLFGMKSTGIVIFGLGMVTVITLKAFMASKLALLVTVGMAIKKLYETYGAGVPEASNVLWKLARYFRLLFGLPEPPLTSPSMPMPMYSLPQMEMPQMPQMPSQMYNPTMAMPNP